MLDKDEAALNARFAAGMDEADFQVIVDNQPDETIDQSRIFTRWTIQPGDSELIQTDGMMIQLGVAYFQIIAPLETWTDEAHDLRDQFLNLFRNWRSEDRCLQVYKLGVDKPPNKTAYQINCKVFWRSHRKS
jgi:hypothetical protein